MSGKTFLLDTNIIIHLSYGELNTSDFSSSGDRLCISAITYMEALGYPFKTKEDESFVKMLCNSFDLFDLTKPIIEKTIEIRKRSKKNFQMPLLLQVRWLITPRLLPTM